MKNQPIQLTNGLNAEMLLNKVLTDKDFLSRFAGNYDTTCFLKLDNTPEMSAYQKLATIAVEWGKDHDFCPPTREIVKSALEKENETSKEKVEVEPILSAMDKVIAFDQSSFPPSELVKYIEDFYRKMMVKSFNLEMYQSGEKMSASEATSFARDRLDRIDKVLLRNEKAGVSVSQSNMESLEKFIEWVSNPSQRIPTGFMGLDDALNGGVLKKGKSLYVFMAQTGLGKSNLMVNLAVNFMRQNLKPLIVSLEMSEDVYQRRIYSVMSDICIDDLPRMTSQLRESITNFYQCHNEAMLMLKEFPVKSVSSSDIKNYIDGLETKPDVVLVDYLNLLKTNSESRNAGMYEEGLRISEELRAISQKLEIPVITAVQSNTEGINSDDISLKNISGSRGIGHTADFIGILFKKEEDREKEKENGGADTISRLILKVDKSRFGKVGNLIELGFNKNTLKIVDYDTVAMLSGTIANTNATSGNRVEIDDDIFGGCLAQVKAGFSDRLLGAVKNGNYNEEANKIKEELEVK